MHYFILRLLLYVGIAVAIPSMAAFVTSESSLQAQAPEDRRTPYTVRHEWTSGNQERHGEGLFLFSNSSAGAVMTLLVETPAENRVVIREEVAAQHGWDRERFVDDASGWWFELSRRYDVRASGFREFLYKAMDWFEAGHGRTLRVQLRSSDGLNFQTEILVESDASRMNRAIAEELRRAGGVAAVPSSMPETAAEAIAFLDAATKLYNLRGVVEVLAALAPAETRKWGYLGLGWEEAEEFVQRGVNLTSPEAIDFASRFTHIDSVQPLGKDPLERLAVGAPN